MLENRYICFEIDLHEYYRNIPGLFLFQENKKITLVVPMNISKTIYFVVLDIKQIK